MNTSRVYKISVNLPESSFAALEALASRRGKSLSQIIRGALATQACLQQVLDKCGDVLIQNTDGTLERLILR